ncbi:hypothetical protein CCAX7_14330 [Capsulimonas corticalis]|uniref:Uncharacterized protein n=1 Tax=Capsulimonas corticalis TaxID=2219043 RepID=A0A402D739_9BACT|nr:hypothetical protein [Capsulimonas corticalis]BDI29382.1 hypothetical protein CCAX7_14330 [Capsulimonas corticalis]
MKNHPSPVPSLHYVMILASVAIILVSMILYLVAPQAKEVMFSGVALTTLGFLTGKLSNQFGRPWRVARSVNAEPDEDEDEPMEEPRLHIVSKYGSDKMPEAAHADQAIISTASPTKEETNVPAAPPTL